MIIIYYMPKVILQLGWKVLLNIKFDFTVNVKK